MIFPLGNPIPPNMLRSLLAVATCHRLFPIEYYSETASSAESEFIPQGGTEKSALFLRVLTCIFGDLDSDNIRGGVFSSVSKWP